jgi:prepilin-type processing-associated H-X9-DG protein
MAAFRNEGTSNTLLAAEVLAGKHARDQRGAWALPWNAASLLAFDMHHNESNASGRYEYNPASLGMTQSPNSTGPNVDMLYECPDPAGSQLARMPCGEWSPTGPSRYLSAATRSHHPGGVNSLFVDGHVGFLPDGVDEILMAYLISITDGNPVSESSITQ